MISSASSPIVRRRCAAEIKAVDIIARWHAGSALSNEQALVLSELMVQDRVRLLTACYEHAGSAA